MELTCWVWLVALGSAGVANAEIPQIGCTGGDNFGLGGDKCDAMADALNNLDGVSGVKCGGYYPYLYTDVPGPLNGCTAAAAALNKLDGVSGISCDVEWFYLTVADGSCPAVPAKLTAILQGPTCKHGNPISGPSGGGKCKACDKGWQGSNCDSPSPPPALSAVPGKTMTAAGFAAPQNYSAAKAQDRNISALLKIYNGYTFEHFMAEFGKVYEGEEYNKRRQLFQKSGDRSFNHNEDYAKGKHTWYMGVTPLADWTEEELKQLRGHKKGAAWTLETSVDTTTSLSAEELPASVDWRTKKVVTPVKNQAACGSCWAFSATESVESAYAIASGKLIELAPQTYVSCMKNPQQCGGTGGCEGATAELGFNYSKTKGIAKAADFPYTSSDSKCLQYTPAVMVGGYVKLPANDANALATALATKGPISISVAAGGIGWQLYRGGIMSGCKSTDVDHAVQAVGYGKDGEKSYWLVRNSWGPKWGEKGYIRLSRDMDNTIMTDSTPADGFGCKKGPSSIKVAGECGMLSDSAYPTGVTAATTEVIV